MVCINQTWISLKKTAKYKFVKLYDYICLLLNIINYYNE